MKPFMFRIAYWSIITFLVLTFLSACDLFKPEDEPEDKGSVAGYVYSMAKSPLQGVTVTIGTNNTVTDADGHFHLTDVQAGNYVLVNFKKTSYIGTQKIVAVTRDNTTNTSCTMFEASHTNLNSTVPNILSSNGAEISIPANAFVANGVPFTGSVYAEYLYFDPGNSVNLDAFPGNFSGVQTDGTEVMFETYGFINASFYDAANTNIKLSLASGVSALITVPIPLQLQSNAPQDIPMWYYNESTGKWMEEGAATKVGNTYQGSVSHFTWWNFDAKIPVNRQAFLTGKVVMNDANNTPVADAMVVCSGVSYFGNTGAVTDANGNFSIIVQANSQVRIQAFEGENISNPSSPINSPAPGVTSNIGNVVLNESSVIKGTVVDENNVPFTNVLGKVFEMNPPSDLDIFDVEINPDETGHFYFLANNFDPGDEFTFIINLFTGNGPYSYSAPITITIPQNGQAVNLGNVVIPGLAQIRATAMDMDGNVLEDMAGSGRFFRTGEPNEGAQIAVYCMPGGEIVLVGPPNASLENMNGELWIQGHRYTCMAMTLNFPGSEQTNNIGNVYFLP
jgi:protocatechuate 3,4-dioxygenase beta subunit